MAAESRQYTVLYAEPIPAELASIMAEALPRGFQLQVVATRERDELLRRAGQADFMVVAVARVDEALLRAAPRLRLVQHLGVGYDNIDVAACRRAGVPVALMPLNVETGVAEHAILLMLAVYKQLPRADAGVRAGAWPNWALRSRSFELAGKMLGLVGFGRVGRAVARRAVAFDVRVVYHDIVRAPRELEETLGAVPLSLDELLGRADVVSLHVPLTAETRGLIGARELGLMGRDAVLINTSRGPVVDEAALTDALVSGRIAGAGLDVLDREPPDPANPLLKLDNVVLTPHIGTGTRDAFAAKMRAAAENIRRVADREAPLYQVDG